MRRRLVASPALLIGALLAATITPTVALAAASTPPATSEPAPLGRDDGILRIGVLLGSLASALVGYLFLRAVTEAPRT